MIVIADASPIIALYEIGRLNLLRDVYQIVAITEIVAMEVEIDLPDWIVIDDKYDRALFQSIRLGLDDGEASAIALAFKHEDPTLVIDERRGRRIAKEFGIEVIGLLGVITRAKNRELIDEGMPIIEALVRNGFRLSDKLKEIVRQDLEEE